MEKAEINLSNIKAPYLDNLIRSAQADPILCDSKCHLLLLKIIEEIYKIEKQGEDELRSVWFPVERGKIEDFGDYQEYLDEDAVTNYQDFVEIWEYYYPEEIKWYKLALVSYKNEFYFYFDNKLTFHLKPENENKNDKIYDYNIELTDWIINNVNNIISQLISNTDNYNNYIKNNLSFHKRIGRIVRTDFWDIFKEECVDFRTEINIEQLSILKKIVEQLALSEPEILMPTMTSSIFFECCKMGYTINKYFENETKTLTAKEMYARMADGRDCGLKEIDLNSESAFLDWYNNERNCGGHPWEICRGGNSTHISLYVIKKNNGWYLRLAGSSSTRVIETALFAVALYKNNVAFVLDSAQEIYNMLTGTDFIGIVPNNIIPRYCHSYFPADDKIIDFMNLGFEKVPEIIEKSYWYPVAEIKLIKNDAFFDQNDSKN